MEVYSFNDKVLQYNSKCIAPKATGETWLLNEEIPIPQVTHTWNVNFTSNGITYTKLSWEESQKRILVYDSTVVFWQFPMPSWLDQVYRTITFLEAPTGDLLTWLQNNGVK